MNATKNKTETSKMPFPSQVTEACQNVEVQALSREIVDTARDKNNLLASAGNVHYFVRDHYVDTQTGTYGIESLIANILKSHGAIFPAGIGATELRKVAVAASMLAEDIISEVQATFGKDRYPYATIHTYLSVFMVRKEKVGKIKLSNSEDQPRTCCKPRCKWYLIDK
jgi:hypothetical protein